MTPVQEHDEQAAARRAQRLEQLQAEFDSFVKSANQLQEPRYALQGVTITAQPHAVAVNYQWLEVTAYQTTKLNGAIWMGVVSFVLTKHPLDDSRPVLGEVQFDTGGMTDRVLQRNASIVSLAAYCPEFFMEFIQAALTHQSGPAKTVAGVHV